jgi:hypothetical protein
VLGSKDRTKRREASSGYATTDESNIRRIEV